MEENKMGVMPINKLLLTMSLPMVASMLIQALYNIVDSMFVGRYDINALTAVSLAFPYQNLMIAVATGTGVGMNAILSKSLGEKNFKKANIVAGNGFLLALISAVVFAILGFSVSEIFFRLQNSNEVIVEYGRQYLTVCSGLSFGLFGQIIFERMLQSTGKTMFSMFSQGIGAIINIILDPIMIFGYFGFPSLGVTGAALATAIAQIASMFIAFYFNRRYNEYINLKREYMKIRADIVKKIYEIGLPSILMVAVGSVMTFLLNKILGGFDNISTPYGIGAGTLATTVFGVYFKLQSFVFMPVFGLNNGMVPIIAYNYGAKNRDRIKKTIKLSIIYAVSIMLVGFLIFQLFPDKLISLFNDNESLLNIGDTALRRISISFIFAGFCIVSSSVFQAMGKGIYSLLVSFSRQILFLLPLAFIFSLTENLDLVWCAFPLAEIIAVVLCCFFLKRLFRKINI